jgi:hypothetical protein
MYSQLDAYVRQLRLLARAEYPSESLERMLAVIRLVICCQTDLLRPGTTYRDTPHVLLGSHVLTQRELGKDSPATEANFLDFSGPCLNN